MKRISMFLGSLVLVGVGVAMLPGQQNADKQNLFQQYMEKYGPPGPEHKLLEPLVGSWHAKVTVWMDPSQAAQTSDGTLVRKSIMDGRFVHEDFQGKMMGKPFQGMGVIGFDRAKGKFVTTWLDSAGTAIHQSRGTYDESAKTWTFKNEEDCPITGKRVKMRDVLRIVSANEEHMEMFKQLGDEKEMKVMEITLTRNK